MFPKLFKMLSLVAILALAFSLLGNSKNARAMPCDAAYVSVSGPAIIVSPTGTDDTVNLQCAFDAAVAAGPGMNVRLAAGTYHTAQIVVNDFHGKFTGAGLEETRIVNRPNLYVTPVDYYFNPPSAENPSPYLFAFVGGDFTISQLSIYIQGEEITQGWSIYGIGPVTILATAVAIEGAQVNATIDHVLVQGEAMEGSDYGYNVINGIFYQGYIGEIQPPISGSFQVTNSTFRSINGGTPLYNMADASILISHNVYEDNWWAVTGSDFMNSSFEFSYNKVDAYQGVWFYNFAQPADIGTSFVVSNNHFQGQDGVVFDQGYGAGNQCRITDNNVKGLSGQLVILGPGIDCVVK